MPVAIPIIAAAVSTAGSVAASKIAANSAAKRSAEEKAALEKGQGAAGLLTGAAPGLVKQGQAATTEGLDTLRTGLSTMAPAASYYGTLLRGNRALQSQATAAPRAAIQDTYAGAERNLERGGVRGAAKDVATADLGRQRAGQIASLLTGVQPGAAAGAAGVGAQQAGVGSEQATIGLNRTSMGGSFAQGGGALASGQMQQGFQNRVYGREEGGQFGSQMGGFLFDILSSLGNKRGGGGFKPLSGVQMGMPNALPGAINIPGLG